MKSDVLFPHETGLDDVIEEAPVRVGFIARPESSRHHGKAAKGSLDWILGGGLDFLIPIKIGGQNFGKTIELF